MFKFIAFFTLLVAVSAKVNECTKGELAPLPLGIRIEGCPDPDVVCRIIRGTNIRGEFDFIACELNGFLLI